MGREGVEGDVADDADLRHLLLDCAHRAADEVVRVERLLAIRALVLRIGHRKERDGRNAHVGGLPHRVDQQVHGEPLDAGHRGDVGPFPLPFTDEDGPDQVVRSERVFAGQAAGPVVASVPAHANARIGARQSVVSIVGHRRR